jgi:hypothetical protein
LEGVTIMQVRSLQLVRIAFCLMFTAGASFAVACDGDNSDGNSEVNNSERGESGSSAQGGKKAPADSSKAGKGGASAPKPTGGTGGKASEEGGKGGDKAPMSNAGKGGSAAAGKGGSAAAGKAGNAAANGGKGGDGAGGKGGPSVADCDSCMKRHPQCQMAWEACENVPGIANKGKGAGTPRAELCKQVVACVREHQCMAGSSIVPCYCGGELVCLDPTMTMAPPTGACKDIIEKAAESTNLTELQANWPDVNYAVGAASVALGLCDAVFCGASCPGACPAGNNDPMCQPQGECGDTDVEVSTLPAVCSQAGGAGGMSGSGGSGGSGGAAAGTGGMGGSGGSSGMGGAAAGSGGKP